MTGMCRTGEPAGGARARSEGGILTHAHLGCAGQVSLWVERGRGRGHSHSLSSGMCRTGEPVGGGRGGGHSHAHMGRAVHVSLWVEGEEGGILTLIWDVPYG